MTFIYLPLRARRVATLAVVLLSGAAPQALAAPFTISAPNTTARTLGPAAGETGNITSTGSLTVSGSTVAVTISGNNATLTNLGLLSQTGTGRAVFDNASTGLTINNGSATNATATIITQNADVVRANVGGVTLNNYGTLTSLNPAAGGSQAVDFEPIHTASTNIINNFATGVMQASEADAVRPGVSGVVNNAGLIKSTTTTGSSSDGVDVQNNTGVVVNNAVDPATGLPSVTGPGLIEGARHGITGGAIDNTVTFTTTVTNNTGGIIKGDNGSGINLDGFDAKQSATIVNNGTITGNGVTGDGDGIDVDGVVNVTNTGVIRSLNAFSAMGSPVAQSEGITVGGGTITNSGTIQGSVAAGNTNAVGRGITLAGNDITAGPLAGTREAIYGNATITNQSGGSIIGDSDSAIMVEGPASGFTVTINNSAGANIMGGGALNAAITTGADNDIINNTGIINGASSGKAIAMGAGNDTLNLFTGASVTGSIDGGDGADTIHLKGAGVGALSNTTNVETLSVDGGHWTLTGSQTYSGNSSIAVSATLEINNAIVEFGNLTVSGALLTDPTTLIFDHDLNIDPTGFIAASFGDLFDVHGDFLDHSTQNTNWKTTGATLKFTGVGAHKVLLTGRDIGALSLGFEDNFAWDDLDLDSGAEIDLASGLSGVLDVAFYTHILEGALFSADDSTITNIIGNGFNIYYDPFAAENAYLGDRTYQLAGGAGGFLAPVPAPEPATLPLVLSGLGIVAWARRRNRRVVMPKG